MPTKPLIFVPGLPGSFLLDSRNREELFLQGLRRDKARVLPRLHGPDDPAPPDGVEAGQPIDRACRFRLLPFLSVLDLSGLLKQADTLYEILERDSGYSGFRIPFGPLFRAVGWDWRLPVDHGRATGDLRAAIEDLFTQHRRRVVVIVHSTGGLVLRSLLEQQPALARRIERVIAFGVPWAGTLATLRSLTGRAAFPLLDREETQRAISRSWAAFDLLPPNPRTTDLTDDEGALRLFVNPAGEDGPLVDLRWLPPGSAHMQQRAESADRRLGRRQNSLQLQGERVEVVNFVGYGVQTVTQAELQEAGPRFELALHETAEGDGTVPRRSAAWLRGGDVRTFLVPVGHYPNDRIARRHITLWQNASARQTLAALLNDTPIPEYAYAAVDAFDATGNHPDVRVRVVAFDPAGRPRPGAFAVVRELIGPTIRATLGRDGRAEVPVPRSRMREVRPGLLRFVVDVHATGGAQPDRRHALTVART